MAKKKVQEGMGFTQANSPMAVTTPLGPDKFLLVGFSGQEAISQLFNFQLDVIAENSVVKDVLATNAAAFSKLLGAPVSVEFLLRGRKRYYNGICSRLTQGQQDNTFTSYRIEMVPKLWLLTRRSRSRIFQRLTVPQILDMVFQGTKLGSEKQDPTGPKLDVEYQWNKEGDFKKRDYCVQYRETDFNFACRLMEEEGIHYYFRHTSKGHELWVSDFPAHPSIFEGGPAAPVVYSSSFGYRLEETEEMVLDWQKSQELRAGKYTLRNHSFEMQNPIVDPQGVPTPPKLQVGGVPHSLALADNTAQLEMYDYPGEFVQRFDGVDAGGGDSSADLKNVLPDGTRTAGIRMQEEASAAVQITGTSNCPLFCPGHNFVRTDKDKAREAVLKSDGEYLLVGVTHFAAGPTYISGGMSGSLSYQNSFTCVPTSAAFRRPPRATPKPFVQGSQTATVVGPKDSEIFTDKHGRVKVKFHWDRDDRKDSNSSCWVRVAQVWAGKRWGAFFWPRVGQEVVVTFLEGDPDQPLIIGSVYNFNQPPPYLSDGQKDLPPDQKHKNDNWLCGVKSNTTPGGSGYNEWRFNDAKGKEQVFVHAERNMDTRVKNDSIERVVHDRHLIVGHEKDGKKDGDQFEMVYQDKDLNVKRNQVEQIEGNYQLTVGKGDAKDGGNYEILVEKKKTELIEKDNDLHIKGNRNEQIDGTQSLTVGKDQQEKVKQNHCLEAGQVIHLKAGMTMVLEAGTQLSLKVGSNFIDIGPAGIGIVGTMVMINSGGSAGSGPDAQPQAPKDAQQAKPTKPTDADFSVTGSKSAP